MLGCRGLGILVLPVGWAPLFLTEFLVEWITQDADHYQRESWPLLIACWSSAGALLGLRVALERHAERSPPERHSFLFAPVAWWPWIVAGLGIVITAMRLLGLDP